MSSITRDRVEALAALAHIELSDAEVDLFVRQLGEFLEYATTVQQVDTSGVPPTARVMGGSVGSWARGETRSRLCP